MNIKHQLMYKNILKAVEAASTCSRVSVGAIIVKYGRVMSMGWNGAPSKKEHCLDYFTKKYPNIEFKDEEFFKAEHYDFSRENEIHAEQNAIAYAARNGVSTDGSDLYVSISPCTYCAKLIISAGINNVYYVEKYDRCTSGIRLLVDSNIKCIGI